MIPSLNQEKFEAMCEKENLTCSICLEPYKIPTISTNCLHVFCKVCIEPLKQCALCKTSFKAKHLKHHFEKQNRIDEISAECREPAQKEQNVVEAAEAKLSNLAIATQDRKESTVVNCQSALPCRMHELSDIKDLVTEVREAIDYHFKDGFGKVMIVGGVDYSDIFESIFKKDCIHYSEDYTKRGSLISALSERIVTLKPKVVVWINSKSNPNPCLIGAQQIIKQLAQQEILIPVLSVRVNESEGCSLLCDHTHVTNQQEGKNPNLVSLVRKIVELVGYDSRGLFSELEQWADLLGEEIAKQPAAFVEESNHSPVPSQQALLPLAARGCVRPLPCMMDGLTAPATKDKLFNLAREVVKTFDWDYRKGTGKILIIGGKEYLGFFDKIFREVYLSEAYTREEKGPTALSKAIRDPKIHPHAIVWVDSKSNCEEMRNPKSQKGEKWRMALETIQELKLPVISLRVGEFEGCSFIGEHFHVTHKEPGKNPNLLSVARTIIQLLGNYETTPKLYPLEESADALEVQAKLPPAYVELAPLPSAPAPAAPAPAQKPTANPNPFAASMSRTIQEAEAADEAKYAQTIKVLSDLFDSGLKEHKHKTMIFDVSGLPKNAIEFFITAARDLRLPVKRYTYTGGDDVHITNPNGTGKDSHRYSNISSCINKKEVYSIAKW